MRKTFETKGPKQEGALPLDQRARQIFAYFKQYNYDVKESGDVIRFVGNYKASRGQAAALTCYVFMGKSCLLADYDPTIIIIIIITRFSQVCVAQVLSRQAG